MSNSYECLRKDDYQYKLIRMVDDWLIDKQIGNRYEKNFIRGLSSYNGSGSNELDITFYFRPKNSNGDINQLQLIKDTFGEKNIDEKLIQNGVEMKVGLLRYDKQRKNGDYWCGVMCKTTKEEIDKEKN